jgi:DNA polymerase family A
VRGIRVDPFMVRTVKDLLARELDQVLGRLRANGLVRADGSKDTKAAAARMMWACQQRGRMPKMTAGGAKSAPSVSLDEEACLESGDGVLADYAAYTSISTMLTKDIEALEVPAQRGMPVQSRFETLLETGRTSCSGGGKGGGSTYSYQLQNPRRKLGIERLEKLDKKLDEKVGVRQCFVARDGFVFSSNDYGMFEACSWCQASIDIGKPIYRMIDALNAGQDVHLRLGARWLGTSYEDVSARKKTPEIKETRQRCKPGTFGFMGGMGAPTFVLYAKNQYGVIFELDQAKAIRQAWYDEWEPRPYFNFITKLVGAEDKGEVVHVRSMRRRAWVPYTVASNSYFQGLAADCAKDAGYEISRECLLGIKRDGSPSPLFGSRIVNFVHDEFICEHPIDIAHEAAYRVAEIMEETGRRWMPDVPPKVEPALMRRWIKSAEARFDSNKRLIPYEPEA